MAPCGDAFHEGGTACLLGKRQVFDVPEPRIEITEHRICGHVCAHCGHFSRGVFPQDVIAAYLQNHQLLPQDRAAEAMQDLFELGMSAATLATISERIAKKTTPKIEQIEQAVAAEKQNGPKILTPPQGP